MAVLGTPNIGPNGTIVTNTIYGMGDDDLLQLPRINRNQITVGKFIGNGILLPKFFLTYCEKKKCYSDREILLKYEAVGREFAKNLRSVEHLFLTVKQCLVTECFLTCTYRFLRSNKLEEL